MLIEYILYLMNLTCIELFEASVDFSFNIHVV